MAITTDWDATQPGPGDSVGQGDDEIRALKAALTERLNVAGIYILDPDTVPDTKAGRQIIGDGTYGNAANKHRIYESDLTTVGVEIDDSAAVRTIVYGDGLTATQKYKMTIDEISVNNLTVAAANVPSLAPSAFVDGVTGGPYTNATAAFTTVVSRSISTGVATGDILVIFNCEIFHTTTAAPTATLELQVERSSGAGFSTIRTWTAINLPGNVAAGYMMSFVYTDTSGDTNTVSDTATYRIRALEPGAVASLTIDQYSLNLMEVRY